jgi:predicted NUDIX family phosphoesterase
MRLTSELRLILAARSARLPLELGRTGFVPMNGEEAVYVLERAGLWFGPRRDLEHMEEFRQIIPYIVLQTGSRLVRYKRMPAGGEVRLHGRPSVGLGGHIDLADAVARGDQIDLLRTIERAAERELLEELGGVQCTDRRWVGLLVDNDSAVGRVHVGLIGLWRLVALPDALAEDAIGEVAVQPVAELAVDAARLETWSAMLLPWLEDIIRSELLPEANAHRGLALGHQ